MGFELEDGSSITPMSLAYLLIPLEAGPGINAESCGLDDDLDWSLYTQFIVIYTYILKLHCKQLK